ncbi:GAF domain-containing protein [Variovorax sp. KK3]|uniref:GAF domain-containing protein n=1 Tax=Variovorax sp. KK3 TaxID=1855728 RepID=UPI00097C49EC|nr:GAF domain-containing protein [Variovorax sp. KK3]
MALPRTLDSFSAVLRADGPAAALAYLNEGVPHRYSAAYRFAGLKLQNVLLHDKAGEMRPAFLATVPFDQSFCQYVRRDSAFRTDNSSVDPRLQGHPYQGVVVSYHSVPLVSDTGELWGTLSHFDMAPLPLSQEEFALLQGAAELLPNFLLER